MQSINDIQKQVETQISESGSDGGWFYCSVLLVIILFLLQVSRVMEQQKLSKFKKLKKMQKAKKEEQTRKKQQEKENMEREDLNRQIQELGTKAIRQESQFKKIIQNKDQQLENKTKKVPQLSRNSSQMSHKAQSRM